MGIIRVKNVPIVQSADLAAAAGSIADIWTYEVPVRTKLRFKDFGNELSIPANWASVRWDVLVNGYPIAGFTDIRDQMGFQAQRQPCQEAIVPGGSVILFRATSLVLLPGGACRASIAFKYDLEDEE